MGSGPREARLSPDGDAAGSAKRESRRILLAGRRALTGAAVADASRAIVAALRVLPELAGRRRILLYAADADEVSVDALFEDPPDDWEVLLPRVVDEALVAVRYVPGEPLVAGYRGIREPAGVALHAARNISAIDAVIVPGVAFTRDGTRLGRGAGMYDRLLPQLTRAVRIGICMEPFVVQELPHETHDVAVDVLVTDASVRRRETFGGTPPA